MISIVRFWETASQRAKIGTAGYDSQDEFENKLREVQTELVATLAPHYGRNPRVRDLLSPFVVLSDAQNTPATGKLPLPDDYMYLIGVQTEGHPSAPLSVDQVTAVTSSPVRRPTKGQNRFAHYQANGALYLLPAEVLSAVLIYLRAPGDVKLTLVPTETDEDDYLVPSTAPGAVVDLEWPESAFNLLLYAFLEKLGVEMKEQLLVEYANLGLNREQAKTAQP